MVQESLTHFQRTAGVKASFLKLTQINKREGRIIASQNLRLGFVQLLSQPESRRIS